MLECSFSSISQQANMQAEYPGLIRGSAWHTYCIDKACMLLMVCFSVFALVQLGFAVRSAVVSLDNNELCCMSDANAYE